MYTITAIVSGHLVTVQCEERSAKILLGTWTDRTCQGPNGEAIVCFVPDETTTWGKWCSSFRYIVNRADNGGYGRGIFYDRIVQGLMDDEDMREHEAKQVADWYVYAIEPKEE